MAGSMNIVLALAALIRPAYFPDGGLAATHLTYWGWIWLIGGMVQLIVAAGLMMGQEWSRIVGVLIAVAMAVGWFFEMLYMPILGLTMVIISVLMVYGLSTNPQDYSDAT
jgi:hypothetical protein